MANYTLTISPKGQVVLPKAVRNILHSNVVMLRITDNSQVVISPLADLGGALSSYKKESETPFAEVREQAWIASSSLTKNEEGSK